LQHLTSGDEDTLRDSQRLVHIHDHRKTFVEQSDRILGGKRRGGEALIFEKASGDGDAKGQLVIP
jgi:hypothetical protein